MQKKTKVVALCHSFPNVLELCSKVHFSLRYKQKHSHNRRVFFLFCVFLHNIDTSSHDFNRFVKLREGSTTISKKVKHRVAVYIPWEFLPKREIGSKESEHNVTSIDVVIACD